MSAILEVDLRSEAGGARTDRAACTAYLTPPPPGEPQVDEPPAGDGLVAFVHASTMPSSCKDIRAALALCLQNSDCVFIHRNTPADCLRPPLVDTLPTQCQQLKRGYGECKRGMVDMRKRFRGNQPIATSAELEGGASASTSKGMLYAGRGTYDGVDPRATDGREEQRAEEAGWEKYERNDGIVDVRKK